MAQFNTEEIVIGGTEWKTAPFRFNMMTILGGSGASYIDVLLSGVSPLALTNALGLNYIKALGATEQDGTPTPSNPVDIVCNNGVLKIKNLFDKSIFASDTGRDLTYTAYQVPNGEYTMSSPDFPFSLSATNVFFFAGNVSTGASSSDNGVAINKPISITVTDGYYTVAHRYQASSNVNHPIDYNWQIEQGSTATSYIPYGKVYADGTQETVDITNGGTANAEMLLKVGNNQDNQELLTGNITRNVGIKVFDGTESWSYSSNAFRLSEQFSNFDLQIDNNVGYSNYFGVVPYSTGIASLLTDGQCGWNTVGVFTLKNSSTTSISSLKTWLATQYANGTPVIVIYPLATPTTETVSGQSLSASGNCTVTATGSLDNLELELSYKQSI